MAALILLIFTLLFPLDSTAAQQPKATIPTADKKGSKDSPLLKRYEGSYIVSQTRKVSPSSNCHVQIRASAREKIRQQ